MNDQKRENLLNLALDATDAERAASSSLGTGYDFSASTWEVIVRYQGDISFLEESGVRITYLLFQYAILLLPEQLMDDVTNLPQITYMEKPKRLFFADFAGRSISCIHSLQEGPRGTLRRRHAPCLHRLRRGLYASRLPQCRRFLPASCALGSDNPRQSSGRLSPGNPVHPPADQRGAERSRQRGAKPDGSLP